MNRPKVLGFALHEFKQSIPGDFWDGEREKLFELLLPWSEAYGGDGARLAYDEVTMGGGVDWGLVNRGVEAWARGYSYDLAKGMTENTSRYLQQVIPEWIESGEPLPKLIQRLEGSGMFARTRAENVAITETTRVYAQGNIVGWVGAGVQEAEWRTARDELVCDICGPRHGTRMPLPPSLGNLIQVTRDDATGGLGGFFDGIDHPPAHHRCRCWLQPVVIPRQPSTATPWPWEQPAIPKPVPTIPIPEPGQPKPILGGRPAGTPISDILQTPKSPRWEGSNEAINAIESVHGDGDLGKIKLRGTRTVEYGSFERKGILGGGYDHMEVHRINVSFRDLGNPDFHPAMTTAHEFGHCLDYTTLGTRGRPVDRLGDLVAHRKPFSEMVLSSQSPAGAARDAMVELKQALLDSDLYQTLSGMVARVGETITINPYWTSGPVQMSINRDHLNYLMSTRECFARAYAQYIAVKSGNPIMLRELEYLRNSWGEGNKDFLYPTQWADDDFGPIVAAFDKLFVAMGWIQ